MKRNKVRVASRHVDSVPFYRVLVSYRDNAYGKEHHEYYAISTKALQAFTDSVLDTYGYDSSVSVLEMFYQPIDRLFYKLLN